jgi:hypothetical protein
MTATFFYQECPTCGRALRVRINYLGKTVVCEHCQGSFIAQDPHSTAAAPEAHELSSLERAEELLARLDHHRDSLLPLDSLHHTTGGEAVM